MAAVSLDKERRIMDKNPPPGVGRNPPFLMDARWREQLGNATGKPSVCWKEAKSCVWMHLYMDVFCNLLVNSVMTFSDVH